MGANRTQGLGLLAFLIAVVLLAGGAAGGGLLVDIIGMVVLAVSLGVFLKAKPWETREG